MTTANSCRSRLLRGTSLPSQSRPFRRYRCTIPIRHFTGAAIPGAFLGVQEGVTADELKQTYHNLVRTHHPDRMKSLGLGGDYQELATKNMALIDDAYAEVLKKLCN